MQSDNNKIHMDIAHIQILFKQMLRIRRFEEKCAELYTQEKIRGFLHLYIGEEAVAVGVMQALSAEDAVFATYREHGHALARGLCMDKVMSEMFGKITGSSRGRGGSMHIFDIEKKFYGGNAIVAGALPLAVGLALANKMQNKQSVVVCFFGEGAVAEGEFHESLNLAKLWHLPILFVCENNGYAMGTALALSESVQHIFRKAQSYGLKAHAVDGMNVVEVESAANQYCQSIRNGDGPCLLECNTYRFRGHSMFDTQLYRDTEEVEHWKNKGPIKKLRRWLEANGKLTAEELIKIEDEVTNEIEHAIAYAEQSQLEDVSDLYLGVYAKEQS
ncbi:MAG: pyruvate dehydrogenase E1 component alpha subunit [Alphaproteobacteria bacterium]|jgi:pyruvate dehydrogenase E1 component alpha subunit